MEKWKYIEGFDDCYEISNKGRVRSWYGWNGKEYYKRTEPLILKQHTKENGYKQLSLTNKNTRKRFKNAYVHRLVAEAFCDKSGYEEYKGKLQVNHLDFNKSNNHCENLEWCTQKENQKHFFVSDRFDEYVKKETKRKRLKKRKRLDYHKPHVVYIYTETDLSIKDMAKMLPLGRDRITEILKEEGLL